MKNVCWKLLNAIWMQFCREIIDVYQIDAHKDNETSPKLPNNVKKDVKYREF